MAVRIEATRDTYMSSVAQTGNRTGITWDITCRIFEWYESIVTSWTRHFSRGEGGAKCAKALIKKKW